ncbi:hypothetical protein KUA50_015640 (plasmid) [Segatella hominis]|mgnify:FL=1|uniref:hypothetical protein n=1 Tax=Segatella hominis TaxID=2518605 RepID=UPI001C469BC3|nr:hypothetical protein [Segatella hominis]WOZ83120.1 hypothetical protein KUA50_015640 [Segatella hominis]
MKQEEARNMTAEEKATQVKLLSTDLLAEGRTDLLLKAISVPVLEQLRIEAARATLSPLVITKDFRFILPNYGNKEVMLSPIHKSLYMLFLNHPEGIEFKNLIDYREELLAIYNEVGNRVGPDKMVETVNRLTNPLDNAINEKCSRIKAAFSDLMDEYQADYYIINSHIKRHQSTSTKLWFERLKIINLPRELVVMEKD